jgi:hypothetical protein
MTCFPNDQTIEATRQGRILTLPLNRPDKLNAVNKLMHRALTAVLTDATNDPRTGSSDRRRACALSSGGEIGWMQEVIDTGFGQNARKANRVVGVLLKCEKTVSAKLNDHVIGADTKMALFCDVISLPLMRGSAAPSQRGPDRQRLRDGDLAAPHRICAGQRMPGDKGSLYRVIGPTGGGNQPRRGPKARVHRALNDTGSPNPLRSASEQSDCANPGAPAPAHVVPRDSRRRFVEQRRRPVARNPGTRNCEVTSVSRNRKLD